MLVIVSVVNIFSCRLLIRASQKTGTRQYELLARAAGGKALHALSAFAMLVLMFGSLCGVVVILGDLAHAVLASLWGFESVRWATILVTAGALLPLALTTRSMRSKPLEVAGLAALPVLVVLMGIVVVDCVSSGFPGIASGQVSPLVPERGAGGVLESVNIMVFSLYVQPVLMPLLAEMPAGDRGARTMKRAVDATVLVYGITVFGSMGFFGAAAFGRATAGNVMNNSLLSSPAAGACLQAAMLFYALVCSVPMVIALRAFMEGLASKKVSWPKAGTWASHALYTTGIVGASLAGGLLAQGRSEVVFALTGATGVSLVCYVIPAAVHVLLWRRDKTHPSVCPVCSCVGYVDGKLCDDATLGCSCASELARVPDWVAASRLRSVEPLRAMTLPRAPLRALSLVRQPLRSITLARDPRQPASLVREPLRAFSLARGRVFVPIEEKTEDGAASPWSSTQGSSRESELGEPLLGEAPGRAEDPAPPRRPLVASWREVASEVVAPALMGLAGLGVGALGLGALAN